jgi:hypothetical protein
MAAENQMEVSVNPVTTEETLSYTVEQARELIYQHVHDRAICHAMTNTFGSIDIDWEAAKRSLDSFKHGPSWSSLEFRFRAMGSISGPKIEIEFEDDGEFMVECRSEWYTRKVVNTKISIPSCLASANEEDLRSLEQIQRAVELVRSLRTFTQKMSIHQFVETVGDRQERIAATTKANNEIRIRNQLREVIKIVSPRLGEGKSKGFDRIYAKDIPNGEYEVPVYNWDARKPSKSFMVILKDDIGVIVRKK